MGKLLADTRIVAALIALVVVCLTVLAALGKIPGSDVAKVLGGFLSGAGVVWLRGTKPEDKTEEKKTSIPPVLPLLTLCLAFSFLPGASCAAAKPIIRNVNDIAADWCVARYSQMKGLSAEDALRTFCTGEKVLKPWLDLILMGQKNGVAKVGIAHEPECEVAVTKDAADAAVPATDAGRD